VIPAGHRLRVTVASAGFPKYDRNLNTGGDNERETKFVAARQRILHDAAHRSLVRLPIIPR
jgi:predicted acyl esterase